MKKERVVPTRSTQDFEKFVNQLTKGKPYYIKNFSPKRDFDANTATLAEVRNVLATVIRDLEILKGRK